MREQRFTHFIVIEVKNPEILEKLQQFQDDYSRKFPESQFNRCRALVSRSHITLKLVKVPDTEIDQLKQMFRDVTEEFRSVFEDASLNFESVKTRKISRGNQLVYIDVQAGNSEPKIKDLVDTLHKRARGKGWKPNTDSSDFLHCSVFNTKMLPSFRPIPAEESECIETEGNKLDFGTEEITSIQLLSFKKTDKYYEVIDEVHWGHRNITHGYQC